MGLQLQDFGLHYEPEGRLPGQLHLTFAHSGFLHHLAQQAGFGCDVLCFQIGNGQRFDAVQRFADAIQQAVFIGVENGLLLIQKGSDFLVIFGAAGAEVGQIQRVFSEQINQPVFLLADGLDLQMDLFYLSVKLAAALFTLSAEKMIEIRQETFRIPQLSNGAVYQGENIGLGAGGLAAVQSLAAVSVVLILAATFLGHAGGGQGGLAGSTAQKTAERVLVAVAHLPRSLVLHPGQTV
ncbi:MAG: hypothetical protein HS115_17870 [Spirochaetales bacterium]|nr:hypothetical protein [Spirochaetales bacterium]